jgi:lipoprotein LprG
VLLPACGGATQRESDPRTILREAKTTIDATPAVHFLLTSENAHGSGTLITGAEGEAKRPAQFAGHLDVLQSGFAVPVEIVSIGGIFSVKLPFTSRFVRADPAAYGFGDPAQLLDRDHGLSSLLTTARTANLAGRDRINGEEVYEVEVSLPGEEVAALLTSADKTRDVKGRIAIDVDSHQTRRVVLTGPFFDAHTFSTYTAVIDRYGENPAITPPP